MRNFKKSVTPNHLRKHRKMYGFKQKEIAKVLGIRNTSTISRWEKGLYLPSSDNLFKLAGIYGVLIDTLFPHQARTRREEMRSRVAIIRGSSKVIHKP